MSHELVYEILVGEVLLDTGLRQYTGEIPALRSYCFADTLLQLRQVAEQQIQDVLSFYEEEGLEVPVCRKLPPLDETAKAFRVAVKSSPQVHTCVAKSCTCLSGTVAPS